MRTPIAVLAAAFAVLLALPAGPAVADQIPPPKASFKASETVEAGQGRTMQATVYREALRERREIRMQGQTVAIISQPADQNLFMLMPGRGMAMKMDAARAMRDMDTGDLRGFDATALGQETVNGLKTTRYRIEGDNDQGTTFDGHAWITDDGIRVRIAGTVAFSDGTSTPIRINLTDVTRGDQPDDLFRLPDGIRVMDMSKMPSSMQGGPMGGMMGQ
jgi:hypothetical protein